MRTYLMTMAAMVLLAASAVAQGQPVPWANKLFPTSTHNFGTHPVGTQLTHSLPMTNIWRVPIEITEIRVSCGCIKATASTNRLQPGQTGKLDLHMDTTKFDKIGPKTVQIYVHVGPEFKSIAVLSVSATSVQAADIAFAPQSNIDLGTITKGKEATGYIQVTSSRPEWQVIEIVKTETAPFQLAVQNIAENGRRGYKIIATLNGSAPKGEFSEKVTLKTNDPTNKELHFLVRGNVKGTLQYVSNVEVKNLKVGSEGTAFLVLSADQNFTVLGVAGLGAEMALEETSKTPATTHLLKVKVTPTTPGDYRRTLVVQTSLNNETATFHLEGTTLAQ